MFDADAAARARGVCVLLQGQSEFIEKYHEVIDELQYTGWIGCEYRPKGKTSDGLGWLKPYL